jgi:hypothetical protein
VLKPLAVGSIVLLAQGGLVISGVPEKVSEVIVLGIVGLLSWMLSSLHQSSVKRIASLERNMRNFELQAVKKIPGWGPDYKEID